MDLPLFRKHRPEKNRVPKEISGGIKSTLTPCFLKKVGQRPPYEPRVTVVRARARLTEGSYSYEIAR